MIKQETPWEKKNLNVQSSIIFRFEDTDTDADDSVLNNTEYEYQEAIIPMGKISLMNKLLNNGFRFSEISIDLSVDTSVKLPERQLRNISDFAWHLADEQEIVMVFEIVAKGELFTTDKISLDPHYGKLVAGQRYVNWMKTEIENRSAKCYIVTYKGCSVGFFILKHLSETVTNGLLSGMLETKKYRGLGMYQGFCQIQCAKEAGMTKMLGRVSSNNPGVLKINQLLGYKVERMNYLLNKTQSV